MGEVYRARDSRLNREVAIKVLSGSGLDAARQRLIDGFRPAESVWARWAARLGWPRR